MKFLDAKVQFLLSRLDPLFANGTVVDAHLAEYLDAAQASPSAMVRAHGHYTAANAHLQKGEYFDALVATERALRTTPRDPLLQDVCGDVVSCVHGAMEALGRTDPGSEEFGRVYGRLVDLGVASLRNHLSAIHHYRLAGERGKALELLGKMLKAAPNFIGLRAAEVLLTEEEPSATALGHMYEAPMTAAEAAELSAYLGQAAEVKGLASGKEYARGIKRADELLEDGGLPGGARDELLLYKAMMLDESGAPIDGLAILSKLKDSDPVAPGYNQALEECSAMVARKAREVMDKSPSSPALVRFRALLEQTHYSPWWLKLAVAKAEALSGKTVEAMEMVEAALALSPADADYLAGAIEVAGMLGDGGKRLAELRAHVGKLIEDRPWRYHLHALVRAKEPGQKDAA